MTNATREQELIEAAVILHSARNYVHVRPVFGLTPDDYDNICSKWEAIRILRELETQCWIEQ